MKLSLEQLSDMRLALWELRDRDRRSIAALEASHVTDPSYYEGPRARIARITETLALAEAGHTWEIPEWSLPGAVTGLPPLPERTPVRAAYDLGYEEGTGDVGMTYDDDPESPRSMAYDLGRSQRRVDLGLEEPPPGFVGMLESLSLPVSPTGAPVSPSEPRQTVWVLSIDHRHGTNVYVHQTWEGAQADLIGYVRENWQGLTTTEPGPEDDDGALVKAYFEATEGDEFYSLDEQLLQA